MKFRIPFRFLLPVYLRGILMGSADLIPGVSGGTMALITGIYEELIFALSALFRKKNIGLLLGGKWRIWWDKIHGNFLMSLALGILTSVFLLAKLISWLFHHYPVRVWAFFFGLIAASSFLVWRMAGRFRGKLGFVLAGILLALVFVAVRPVPADGDTVGWFFVFLSGALASMAMILPGISGSYILILLGMYAIVLDWVHGLVWLRLAVFVAGVLTGLASFSHLLKWLFARYEQPTLALLGGFLMGSLALIWPWKEGNLPVWPAPGPQAHLGGAVLMALTGVVLIAFLEWQGKKHGN